MRVEPVHCPACQAIVNVPPEMDKVTCEYCGTTSLIEHSQGQVTLKLSQELAGLRQTLQDSSIQTAQSVRATGEDTQKELQRLRLSHELSTIEMRQANVQAELRALQRNPDKKNKVLKAQLADLEREVNVLNTQRAQLHQSLYALSPTESAVKPDFGTTTPQKGGNGFLGCLGWGMLWFILFMFLSGLFGQVAGDAGLFLGFVLSIGLVVYFQRRRRRKALPAV